MSKAALRAGAIGGILGGVMMAVWLMFILWLIGTGFWTLLNLIANTFWRAAPLGPKFSLPAVFIGLIVHVLMSVLFGSLIAAAAWWLPGPRSLIIAGGALFGPVLWLVMQFGIWHAADPAAAQVITPWVFAVAHFIFGVLAAAVAAIIVTDEKTGSTKVQAAADEAVPDGGVFAVRSADRASPPGNSRPGITGAHRRPIAHHPQPTIPGPDQVPGGPAPVSQPSMTASAVSGPSGGPASGSGPAWHRRPLTARNDATLRTTVYTSGGPGMVTDEPARSGGTGAGLTPLETVVGALCGSMGATFAVVARETGFRYDGLTFEATFAADPRGLPGPGLPAQPGMRPYFHTVRVEGHVRGPQPDPRLPDVARLAERRCPVRTLLADAGVTVDLIWHAAARESHPAGAPGSGFPGVPGTPGRPSLP